MPQTAAEVVECAILGGQTCFDGEAKSNTFAGRNIASIPAPVTGRQRRSVVEVSKFRPSVCRSKSETAGSSVGHGTRDAR